MFELAHLHDTVRIAPADFGKPQLQAITDWLNEKYPGRVRTHLRPAASRGGTHGMQSVRTGGHGNATARVRVRAPPCLSSARPQVVPNLGLCIALHDIYIVGESHILPGSGSQHMTVEFRLVIFKPHVGEVLTGTVVSCDADGARISLGFFDNVYLPSRLMCDDSTWSEQEQLWVWNVTPEDELWLDLENPVRVRVDTVRFAPPSNMASAKQAALLLAAAEYQADAQRQAQREKAAAKAGTIAGKQRMVAKPAALPPPPPVEPAMQITVSIAESGLGLTSWWPPDDPDAEADEAEDDEMGEDGS